MRSIEVRTYCTHPTTLRCCWRYDTLIASWTQHTHTHKIVCPSISSNEKLDVGANRASTALLKDLLQDPFQAEPLQSMSGRLGGWSRAVHEKSARIVVSGVVHWRGPSPVKCFVPLRSSARKSLGWNFLPPAIPLSASTSSHAFLAAVETCFTRTPSKLGLPVLLYLVSRMVYSPVCHADNIERLRCPAFP